MSIKIISYNLNGIRAAMKKGLVDWLQATPCDVFCVQETKAQPDQIEVEPLEALGYKAYLHSAEKKGYSGVATFSKIEPDLVEAGCGISRYDSEGRILRTDFGDWTLLNCYFPSGTSGEERQAFKMEFLDDFFKWVQELRKKRPNLLIIGDYNIAHREIDIHDPVGNKKSSGFLPEERAWMDRWFANGFSDSFRIKHPDKVEYSWWTLRANARANNKGWRIDYQSASGQLADKLVDAYQMMKVVHSDHCPVFAEFDL